MEKSVSNTKGFYFNFNYDVESNASNKHVIILKISMAMIV